MLGVSAGEAIAAGMLDGVEAVPCDELLAQAARDNRDRTTISFFMSRYETTNQVFQAVVTNQ